MKNPTPQYISLLIWLTILALAAICSFWPENGMRVLGYDLRWPTIAEMLSNETHASSVEDVNPEDSVETVELKTTIEESVKEESVKEVSVKEVSVKEESVKAEPIKEAPVKEESVKLAPVIAEQIHEEPVVVASTEVEVNNRSALARFFESLSMAKEHPMRVVHYGDSQIEEDRITMVLREHLQRLYGGGGVGLIPLHQTIPTRTITQQLTLHGQVQSTSGGPKRYMVYGPRTMRRKDGFYGPMGQAAELTGNERATLTIKPRTNERNSYHYFSRIQLVADYSVLLSSNTDSIFHHGYIDLPDSTTECTIRFKGDGLVYGISLETPTGVSVDNVPMRGSSGAIFTNIDSIQLKRFYAQTNTRLIILQYGGNSLVSLEDRHAVRAAVSALEKQVVYIKRCAPRASILFIGPSDMETMIGGRMQTYPMLPVMDEQLARMASRQNIAYYSMYHAMGGAGSMHKWVEKGWAGRDHIHFTRNGAMHAGEQLWQWLIEQR